MQVFFGYIRVSTARQGEQGVSLQEQRDAISQYAARNMLHISEWFEERETAAKRGRPVFDRMLRLLRRGKAAGVIIHKIDRGARNLRDWAELGELSDQGVAIRFTQDSVDLGSRSGRLSADILAVVAADYIRNLREETRKGFYGRIKQGLFPLPAPIGYLDVGPGKPKEPDPATASLIRLAFELYATGEYSLERLRDELDRRGLRNRRGGPVTLHGVSVFLNNPFYLGLIRLKRTGEIFRGAHEPIITKNLFDRVHAVLVGKTATRLAKHDFLFRQLLACAACGYSLIGELQRGHIYYRCHTRKCDGACVREEVIEAQLERCLTQLALEPAEAQLLPQLCRQEIDGAGDDPAQQIRELTLKSHSLQSRLARLTDAYLDGVLERELFEQRKTPLLFEQKEVDDRLARVSAETHNLPQRLSDFLELAGSVYLSYKTANTVEKRALLDIITSNIAARGKTLDFTLVPPFREVAERHEIANGAPYRGDPRTLGPMIKKLGQWLRENEWTKVDEYLLRRNELADDLAA